MLADLFGAIERGLGAALSGIYGVIPNYGLAIVLLTAAVRALLIPVTVKQIRGMAAQQRLQPEMQKIRSKYKGLQQKAKDRTEVQQLRLKMNEEVQGLFKEHGVNPASGCLPLLAQMPFFIALFSVVRSALIVLPTTIAMQGGAAVAPDLYTDAQLKATICRPVSMPKASGAAPTTIECVTEDGPTQRFDLGGFKDRTGEADAADAGWVTHCNPFKDEETKDLRFRCQSALSTGHIPREGRLFRDLTIDRAKFLGMQPGCTPSQSSSDMGVRRCTSTEEKGGLAKALPYFLLVLLIVGSQYYQAKQMQDRMHKQGTDLGPAAQSQQMTMKLMPLIFGFLSFTLPAGSNMYFLATNLWTIGQQHILFARQDKGGPGGVGAKGPKPDKTPPAIEEPKPSEQSGKPNPNASKKKKRR